MAEITTPDGKMAATQRLGLKACDANAGSATRELSAPKSAVSWEHQARLRVKYSRIAVEPALRSG